LQWREANFSLSDSDSCSRRIRSAYRVAFDILHALSKSVVSELSKLPREPRLFEVDNLDGANNENPLHPISIEPQWNMVSEEILRICSSSAKGVWLSYFNIFVLTHNAIDECLPELTEAVTAIFRKHNLKLPQLYRFPVILTEDMFRALLCSCHLGNAFLYYDCFYNKTLCKGNMDSYHVIEPPQSVLFNMAREALSIQSINIRQSDKRMLNIHGLFRMILKTLRLKVFFCVEKIIVPYERVFDYYVHAFPEDAKWMLCLKHDTQGNRDLGAQKKEELFNRYYPKIRSLIDGMSWVFDPGLTLERLHRDRP
jgi:hypothetical protein